MSHTNMHLVLLASLLPAGRVWPNVLRAPNENCDITFRPGGNTTHTPPHCHLTIATFFHGVDASKENEPVDPHAYFMGRIYALKDEDLETLLDVPHHGLFAAERAREEVFWLLWPRDVHPQAVFGGCCFGPITRPLREVRGPSRTPTKKPSRNYDQERRDKAEAFVRGVHAKEGVGVHYEEGKRYREEAAQWDSLMADWPASKDPPNMANGCCTADECPEQLAMNKVVWVDECTHVPYRCIAEAMKKL